MIAEVAQAHDGSLGTAHAYIDAIADAGADAVKFQTHIAAAESTPGEPWRVKFSPQDETRYAYWQRMEFTAEQWRGLSEHAAQRGLIFLSTPFSEAAIDLLCQSVDMPAWKIGSGEVTNLPFLKRIAGEGKPVLLSSGMASWAELDAAMEAIRGAGAPVAVFQCTTEYPTPPEHVGLNVLAELRERYDCPVGLSDHSAQVAAGTAAVALGAELLEVHVTLSKQAFGPDVPASLTIEELASLVRASRFVRTALRHPVDKDAMAEDLGELKATFQKSLVAARDLPAGHVLESGDLLCKKPGTGMSPDRLDEIMGRTLAHPIKRDTLLSETDLRD